MNMDLLLRRALGAADHLLWYLNYQTGGREYRSSR
jgi:hypothetical protein